MTQPLRKLVALARRGRTIAGAALVIAGLAVIPCPSIMRHDGRC